MATSPAAAATTETGQPASATATPGYTTPSPALTRKPPAPRRQPPAPTTMRLGATAALFGDAGRTPTPALSDDDGEDGSQELNRERPIRQRRIGSHIIRPDSQRRENTTTSEETESWILYFQLIGATPRQEFAEIEIDRNDLTFGNLLTMKSRLGYSVRDFLYYKKRCGNGVAKMIEIDEELDVDGMITINDEEREVRLALSRDKITEQNVTITPIKLPPGTAFYEDFTDEPIDEYKDWLAQLHAEGVGREYKDTFREDTVKTYSKWLRLEGKFDDIEVYEQNPSTQSSEASNPTPPTQWPAHARRIKNRFLDK